MCDLLRITQAWLTPEEKGPSILERVVFDRYLKALPQEVKKTVSQGDPRTLELSGTLRKSLRTKTTLHYAPTLLPVTGRRNFLFSHLRRSKGKKSRCLLGGKFGTAQLEDPNLLHAQSHVTEIEGSPVPGVSPALRQSSDVSFGTELTAAQQQYPYRGTNTRMPTPCQDAMDSGQLSPRPPGRS
ncbi:hypothetical protein SKAU_G00287320 [Synaphobranchus kaupii]|uniref:SCAN box domain-containing protein n=1 Tax=Synaphobranchus kaupii TaxID=118154 RepID=A0A9Q1EY98_SYNKA|nr:hypothetical protein SKAU_G00287320 [Synaphobranchus kaupii]